MSNNDDYNMQDLYDKGNFDYDGGLDNPNQNNMNDNTDYGLNTDYYEPNNQQEFGQDINMQEYDEFGNPIEQGQGYQQQNQGYQQQNQGQGYQQQNQGFQDQGQGFQEQNQGFQEQNQGFQEQNQGFQQNFNQPQMLYDEYGNPILDDFGNPVYDTGFQEPQQNNQRQRPQKQSFITDMIEKFKSASKPVKIGIIAGVIVLLVIAGKNLSKESAPVTQSYVYHVNEQGLPMDEYGDLIIVQYDEEGNPIPLPVHPDMIETYGEYFTPDLSQEVDVGVVSTFDEEQAELRRQEELAAKMKPVSVKALPGGFFADNPDLAKIKETPFRDLGIEIDFQSTNPFTLYNFKGTLDPFTREGGYINRELIGRVLNYEMFTNIFLYQTKENLDRISYEDRPAFISNEFNRERAMEVVKKQIAEVKKLGVYPDLEIHEDDVVLNKIMNLLDNSTFTTEESAEFFIPNVEFTEDTVEETFLLELQTEIINKINLLPSGKLSNEEMGKILFKIYKQQVQVNLNNYKDLACGELNEYRPGICTASQDLSTLEITSDFIEDVYIKAYKKSVEDFYYLMYRVYDKQIIPSDTGDILMTY